MHRITRSKDIVPDDLKDINSEIQGTGGSKHFDFAGEGSFGAGILEVKGPTTYPVHADPYDEVLYVAEGLITLVRNGKEKTLHKGDILWNRSQVLVEDCLKAFFVLQPFVWPNEAVLSTGQQYPPLEFSTKDRKFSKKNAEK